ncbi:MAG: ABC transporter ATP-binding protein [Magnetococcales bacterium]|nr:ABC transporter ATP-binding protein [Magnetococcales bacterium]
MSLNDSSHSTPLLELETITCGYDPNKPVVRALSFSVAKGEMISLLGSSGCGKTTVLRAIAGFNPVHSGQILLRGKTLSKAGFTLPPEKRQVGMVFQDYALFPHLTVEQNVAYGLKGHPRERIQSITHEMLQLVGLESMTRRHPHELSGGQQQRVALARALAPHPELILFDEPFSNLDVDLRERLGLEVRQILTSQGTTGILVTHDQHEAFAWGDRIGILHKGSLCQWGTPYELYHQPVDPFVAGFIGQGTFLYGTCDFPDTVQTAAGLLTGKPSGYRPKVGDAVRVLIRPDDVKKDDDSPILTRVVRRAFQGASTLYTLELTTGCQLQALFPSHMDYGIGTQLPIRVAPDHLVLFANPTPGMLYECRPSTLE